MILNLTILTLCMGILIFGAYDSHSRLTSEEDHSDGATFVYFSLFILCLLAGFAWIAITILTVIQ